MTRDSLYNIVALSLQIKPFIHTIQLTLGDLCVFGFNEHLVEKLKSYVGRKDLPAQILTYDTTFNLGDFYLSILAFAGTEFEECPVIPSFYLIHEEKHLKFITFSGEIFYVQPCLKKTCGFYIVTDEEATIVQSTKKHLPGADVFHCWNHVIKDENYRNFQALRKMSKIYMSMTNKTNLDGRKRTLSRILQQITIILFVT